MTSIFWKSPASKLRGYLTCALAAQQAGLAEHSLLDLLGYVSQQWNNMNQIVGHISALATLDQLHEINIIT